MAGRGRLSHITLEIQRFCGLSDPSEAPSVPVSRTRVEQICELAGASIRSIGQLLGVVFLRVHRIIQHLRVQAPSLSLQLRRPPEGTGE